MLRTIEFIDRREAVLRHLITWLDMGIVFGGIFHHFHEDSAVALFRTCMLRDVAILEDHDVGGHIVYVATLDSIKAAFTSKAQYDLLAAERTRLLTNMADMQRSQYWDKEECNKETGAKVKSICAEMDMLNERVRAEAVVGMMGAMVV